MRRGFFLTIEGGEGAGKTTAIMMISDLLKSRHLPFIITREPGGVAIAEQIRTIILDKANGAMDARTEALLYAAARRQHLVEKVIPALNAGHIVVSDRFIDSSLVYQGIARGLGMDAIMEINRFAVEDWMPDLTIYMDVSPETGLSRIHADGQREMNRLDLESQAFHRQVRDGFLQLASLFPERIVQVNAEQPIEAVFRDIRHSLNENMPKGIQ